MSVFSYEWKKLMIYQRGLCYILAALLVSTVWLAATDRPQNSAMEEYREEYEWYLERLDGAYTEDKAAWLEQEAQAITEARYARSGSQESYYSGQITAEQYEQQIAEVNTVLAHEHGFEAAYRQYLYVCENTGNRYFLNTNGWAGLFSSQALDFPLFLVILILAATVFCSEYSCQMDALLRTAPQSRKSARSKAVMTLCAVFVLCGGLALIRFVFFGMKYGLPHGEYPVQSIASFGGSTKNVSLLAAYLILTVLRCFGSVYLAALLLFTSVLVKKYALTVVIGVASTLIPYIGLSRQICYRLPLPLPFLLASGFLEGASFVEDSLTGEPIVTFSERSPQELLALLGLSAVCCALMVWWVLRQNTNYWQAGRKPVKGCGAAVLCLLVLLSLSGCSAKESTNGIFNSSSQSVSETYSVIFDDQTRTYSLENRATGALTDLALSPLFGVFSDGESIKAVYMDAPYIYYMTSRTDQYVDRVGSYNSTATQVSIVQFHTETFEEQVIFKKITDSGRSLLGIDYTVGDTWMFLQYCYGFFLNNDSLFFITNDGITEVSRTIQRTKVLDIPTRGNIAFDGRTIYFINENSLLTAYDTKTHKTRPFRNIVASDFCLTEQGLYFINRMDSDRVYLCGRDGVGCLKISNDPALSVGYDGEKVTMILKSDGKEVVFEP
ncbi:ABC transporter permease [Anaerotruncus colihominis]|nr:ABC transporter permease [Anaerotruncus colihominis]